MKDVRTLVISRSWKDAFDQRELDALGRALSAAMGPQIRFRSVPTDDSEEIHVTIEEE